MRVLLLLFCAIVLHFPFCFFTESIEISMRLRKNAVQFLKDENDDEMKFGNNLNFARDYLGIVENFVKSFRAFIRHKWLAGGLWIDIF